MHSSMDEHAWKYVIDAAILFLSDGNSFEAFAQQREKVIQ